MGIFVELTKYDRNRFDDIDKKIQVNATLIAVIEENGAVDQRDSAERAGADARQGIPGRDPAAGARPDGAGLSRLDLAQGGGRSRRLACPST